MKEFKTIAEQIEILRGRGMSIGDGAEAVLLRENYYSVVNGYKDPFLDREAMQSADGDVYLEGTEFGWMYSLFLFDRKLRQLTFSYLIQAEAALKTATVYAFCEKHRGASDYDIGRDALTPTRLPYQRSTQHVSQFLFTRAEEMGRPVVRLAFVEAPEGFELSPILMFAQFEKPPIKGAAEAASFEVGDSIRHKTFGEGTVTKIDGTTMRARFKKSRGEKELYIPFAPIVKI